MPIKFYENDTIIHCTRPLIKQNFNLSFEDYKPNFSEIVTIKIPKYY